MSRNPFKEGKDNKDAYGMMLLACHQGKTSAPEIIERDDSLVSISLSPERYFSKYPKWRQREREAIGLVKGRVLDVGCGAARHALYLQSRGFDVTGIDNSPGAVKVSKLRGLRKAEQLSITGIRKYPAGSFDTIIMMGNNFGLFGGQDRARRLLHEMYRITSPEGQIIAETTDPYTTTDPVHLAYHRRNRARGRMGGQTRLRLRTGVIVGEWFDYLLVSERELRSLLAGSGWRLEQIIRDEGPGYVAVMRKAASSN